jgi:hypothetical protein
MRSIKIFSLALFLISICLSQERGIGLRESGRANFQSFYKNSWAVVIGINDYITAPKLKYAVRDAEEFTEVLVNYYGFKRENIVKLINREATKENITKAFDKLRSVADKEDRVLVFFAGHGITVPLPDGREKGYILPVDGSQDELITSAISTDQLNEISQLIKAKHLFFIMDACYGGLIFARAQPISPSALDYLEVISTRRARKALTAGGRDQTVLDTGPGGHSVFTYYLIDGLKNRTADLNGDGIITSGELNEYVAPRVTAESNRSQTPEYGILAGDMGGDFVFIPAGAVMKMFNVSITSEPSGADVKINGQTYGKTPLNLRLQSGSYLLEISRGEYEPVSKIIEVGDGFDNSFHYRLEPVSVSIYITSDPGSADVYIDGFRVGTTPSYFKVRKGEHTVLLRKQGYGEKSEKIYAYADTTIRINLEKLLASVLIKSNVPDANIMIKDKVSGNVNVMKMTGNELRVNLPFGNYVISASKEKYASVEKNVNINSSVEYVVNFELVKNVVDFVVNVEGLPDANIFIDGSYYGKGTARIETPVRRTRTVMVEKEGYKRYRAEIPVLDKPAELKVKLEPIKGILKLNTDPTGAFVNIDGSAVGKSPLIAELSYGEHKVTINMPEYKTEEFTIKVINEGEIVKNIVLKERPERIAMRIYKQRVSVKKNLMITNYVLSAVAGVYAFNLNQKANDYYEKYMNSRLLSDIKNYKDKYNDAITKRNIAIGVSAGFAVLGTYFLLKGVSYEEILQEVKSKDVSMLIFPEKETLKFYISFKF